MPFSFYTVHLVSLDGGYIGRTWRQWHTPYLLVARGLLEEEMKKEIYIHENGDVWSRCRQLYSPKDGEPLHFSHQVIGDIYTNNAHGNYMALYISREDMVYG